MKHLDCMKKSTPNLLSAAALLLTLAASCSSNDVFDPDKQQSGQTAELKVPASFSWATTRSVALSISTPTTTAVTLYADEQGKQLLAEAVVSKESPTTLNLDLPISQKELYLQCSVKGAKKMLKQTLTATTRANTSITLPEEVDWYNSDIGASSKGDITMYMPAKGQFGTLLFEDMYPAKGDYDMNDFVAGYYIAPFYSVGIKKTYYEGTDLQLQIRAIGGSHPYRLCVELSSLLTSDIVDATGTYYTTSTTNPDITLELLSSGNQPVVFAINGTEKLKEGNFFNTEEPTSKQLPTVTLSILRNLYNHLEFVMRYNGLSKSENYNFFLQNKHSKQEIHLKGYSTTSLASNNDQLFATPDNFVWGIKVPTLIAHPLERTDISKAYPRFTQWVTSGGTAETDWYTTCVGSLVIK